jgi:hypothetical protein
MVTNIVKRQLFSASGPCVTCALRKDEAVGTRRRERIKPRSRLSRQDSNMLRLHDLRFLPAFFLACFLALVIGCGKPKTSSPQQTASPRGAEGVSTADQVATVLTELTQLVRKYSVEQRKAPKSLDELVAKGYLGSVPQAPNGKRFAINKNLQVYLSEP